MSKPVAEQPTWVSGLIAAGTALLGQGVGIAVIVGWVAVATHWLGMSAEIALLGYIAFAICVVMAEQNKPVRKPESQLPPERDFYIVTHEQYRWSPPTSGMQPRTTKPELGGTIYAYDTLAAAEIKYQQIESEQSPLDLEGKELPYHERFGYEEEETRLWIVYARSKTEAYDKVIYYDSRSSLGVDGRTDDLLLRTNNEHRKKQYLDWWSPLYQAKLKAERSV